MATQDKLFHEDWRDALRHLIKALGGFEAVGADLWPNKTRKAAGSWLSDCLNDERPAKLDLEDLQALLYLGRVRGVHIGMHYLCEATLYRTPDTISSKEQAVDVEERISRHMKDLEGLISQLRDLQGIDEIRRIKAAS